MGSEAANAFQDIIYHSHDTQNLGSDMFTFAFPLAWSVQCHLSLVFLPEAVFLEFKTFAFVPFNI